MRNIEFSLFYKYNLFITSLLFILFLVHNNDYTFISLVLSFFAAISSSIILYLLLYIPISLFSFNRKYGLFLASLTFIIVNIGLVVDFLIFRIYKFHINAMVLNILTSPDAFDSMEIGIAPVIMFLFIVVSFIYLEIILIKRVLLIKTEELKKLNRSLNKKIILPLIFIVFGEKISYGVASLLNKSEILTKFKVIPLYQPLTFNRFAAKYFDYKPKKELQTIVSLNANLNYPLNPMELNNNPNKFNIFIIASDSVRNSILDKEVSPNIEEFKKDAIVFDNHYSGGNSTRFGIFSIFYGLNATYWFNFLNANCGPVLFDVLKNLNYDIDIISSTNTNWPEFKKTTYLNIQEDIADNFKGKPWEKDEQSSNYFLTHIENYSKKKPKFSFLFLDAPHGYSYPKEFNKFNAIGDNINYLTATKGSKEVNQAIARYKNAIYYNDKLFGDIINKMKEENIYDNSMIIFTSDHGQEFYESGYFGHNSAFSKEQTKVPFIVKLPKSFNISTDSSKLTSHLDIVPTILSMIGIKNKSFDYSTGENIFDSNYKRDYAFCANWNNNAVITKNHTYVFSNLPNKMFNNEVRDTSTYKKLLNESKVDSKLILDIMNENKRFIK